MAKTGSVPHSWFERHSKALAALALVILSVTIYAPTLGHPFTSLDDGAYVTENPHVVSGLGWQTIRWSLTATEMGHWHPLTWMSHALDVQLFGLTPAGHHFTSVALHAANTVLLFLFFVSATGETLKSLIVAALFAIHPINVESVAWIAERKSVLSTLWFLAALCAYLWYGRQPNWKRYLAVAGFFLLGLASKAMLVTLPFVLLLLDYWPLRRVPQGTWLSGKLVLEKVPLLFLSAASSVLAVVAQKSVGAMASVERVSVGLRIQNALCSYVLYLWKIVWPARLAILYPYPFHSLSWTKAVGAILFLAAVTALVIRSRREYLMTGWFWFLGTLVPVIGLLQAGPQGMADRYVYIPAIGLFWMAVWGLEEVGRRANADFHGKVAVALVAVIAFSVATVRQLSYWSTNKRLWEHALDVTQNNAVAEDKVGNELSKEGRLDEAYPHFANALRINPSDPLANFSVGVRLHLAGMLRPAIAHYEVTVRQNTDPILRAQGYENMGTAYRQLGEYVNATESYRKALQYDPQRTRLYNALKELENESRSR